VLVTPAQKVPFDVTALWRAKAVRIKLVLKTSPFYAGTLIAGFYPSMFPVTDPIQLSKVDISTLNQLNGPKTHASDNQESVVSIPFRYPYGFVEAPGNCLGQYIVKVQNRLRTGASNQNNVNLTLFAQIDSSEFKIPEMVPAALYTSHKFDQDIKTYQVHSKPQSGITTRIKSTGQVSINDPIMKMKPAMLCAGQGLVSEPRIKQFQDHPIDLVQLRKRFKTAMEILEQPLGKGATINFAIGITDLMLNAFGEMTNMFMLNRGSLIVKIVPYATPKSGATLGDQGFRNNLRFKASLIFPTATGAPQELTQLEIQKDYNGGAHYFNIDEPGEVYIPFFSPLFVATFYDDNPDPFLQQHGILNIEATNFNINDDVILNFEVITALGDDYTCGVFIGTSTDNMPIPTKRNAFVKTIRSRPQSGFCPRPLETCTIGTPIELYAGHKKDVPPPLPADNDRILEKIRLQKILTRGQEQRILNACADGNLNNEQIEVVRRDPYLKMILREVASLPQAGVIEFIDKAIETTLPVVETLDELANLLDAHPITYQRYPITTRKLGYTVPTDLVQYVERLLTTNHNGLSLSDKETYGADKETDIYNLCQNVLSLFDSMTWETSDTNGSLLFSTNVGPGIPSEYKTSPPMDVLAHKFHYWNGSVIYIFDVIASKMHKGQLTVSFHPNRTEAPASLKEATQQYFTSFDLSDGRATVALQIPYLQKKQYLPTYTPNTGVYDPTNCFNGVICLWVQNALRAASTVSDIVDINVYKAAGKDFKFEVYGSNLLPDISVQQKQKAPFTAVLLPTNKFFQKK